MRNTFVASKPAKPQPGPY
jgi:hypothetical protein